MSQLLQQKSRGDRTGRNAMRTEPFNYHDYFHPGQRATVEMSLEGEGVFRDGAVVTAVGETSIAVRLSRQQLPERALLRPESPLVIRVGGSGSGYSCSGILLNDRQEGELRIAFVGEVVSIDARQYFRLGTDLPVIIFNVTAGAAEESCFGGLRVVGKQNLPRIVGISGGGLRTETSMAMTAGDTVYATFQLPLPEQEVIPIVGKVAHSETIRRKGAVVVRAGINFVHINERTRDSIIRYVCNEEITRIRLRRKRCRSLSED
jgi:hypothetical protein